jgi:hypothetical protein
MARDIDFEGIKGSSYVTFKSALIKGTDEGKLVKLSANGTVVVAGDGENFIGIVRIIDAQDKAASVQIDGFVEVLYDADHIPTVTDGQGWQALSAGALPTKVMAQTEAVTVPLRMVVEVDTVALTVTFKL